MNEYVGVADIILTLLILAGSYVAYTFNQKIEKNTNISDREDLRLYSYIEKVEELRRETDKDIFRSILDTKCILHEEIGYRKGKEANNGK